MQEHLELVSGPQYQVQRFCHVGITKAEERVRGATFQGDNELLLDVVLECRQLRRPQVWAPQRADEMQRVGRDVSSPESPPVVAKVHRVLSWV